MSDADTDAQTEQQLENDKKVTILPHRFFEAMFLSSEPFTNPKGQAITLVYTIVLTLFASCLLRMARAKLSKIRNANLNVQGVSVYSVRIIKLLILIMVSTLLVYASLIVLIVGYDVSTKIFGDQAEATSLKKVLVSIMSVFYQLRSLGSSLL